MADGRDDDIQAEPSPARPENTLFVAGIGASAGGLEALRELVAVLPEDAPCAYVIALHLSPDHKSMLSVLIGRETTLPVRDVEDGMTPERNAIYVAPPKMDVIISGGVLRLVQPEAGVAIPKPSVDRLFVSLAEELGERAVGVVLSGTGSDGAYGVRSIREAGGITIAQSEDTAKYDGMPVAALESGCIDISLSPSDIGEHIARILKSPRDLADLRQETSRGSPTTDLLQVLLAKKRVDFRDYKPTTIRRRIERRIVALGLGSVESYTEHCLDHPNEVDALFKDLLISVTRFFRDPEKFEVLRANIAELIDAAKTAPVRAWVAGCATGEEAYSIAVLVAEALGGLDVVEKKRIQIFATDIDADALNVARRGCYPATALYGVDEDIISKYFVTKDGMVQVRPELRSIVLFSHHNVCQDPPFANIDLICCRNLLIYFNSALQAKVLSRFHHSLNEKGVLFLGAAETVSAADALFTPTEERERIYRKRVGSDRTYSSRLSVMPVARRVRTVSDGVAERELETERAVLSGIARSLGEGALLIRHDFTIERVFGDVSRFIALNEDTKLDNSLAMLKPPLASEARSLVTLVLRQGRKRKGVRHLLSPESRTYTQIEAHPIKSRSLTDPMILLALSQEEQTAPVDGATAPDDIVDTQHAAVLQRELETTREALQQTVEELETSNEELQSLNEELQSTNEEMQATNEELETSNEELQSTNEELLTVNEEMQLNSDQLATANADFASILSNLVIPLVVVDRQLQVTRASAAACALFSISDPGSRMHVSQLVTPAEFPQLNEFCDRVMQKGSVAFADTSSEDGSWRISCAPVFDSGGRVNGATLMAVETTLSAP